VNGCSPGGCQGGRIPCAVPRVWRDARGCRSRGASGRAPRCSTNGVARGERGAPQATSRSTTYHRAQMRGRFRTRSGLRRALVGVAVSLASLAPAAGAADTAQPSSSAARPCAASWNSEANARWRSYARQLGSQRAFVQVAGTARPNASGKFVTTARACVVKLWLARRPGHWQSAVIIGGPLRDGNVGYGTRIFPSSATTPRHLRQRVTIQFANSRVRPDGTLAFVGMSIP
jgi:hypothetical protein